MKDNTKVIISIVLVALIIVLVGGGTYAYWQWQSNTTQQTNITVTIPSQGNITMKIDGGGDITTKTLAPAQCTNTTYAIQRKVKVTAENGTSTPMKGTIALNVAALTAAQGTLNSTNKASIKYALVSTDATQYAATGFSKTGDACATSAAASGTFGSVSTGGTITLINNLSIVANNTTTAYYELYLWIDKGYTGATTTGTSITDPLQDLTIRLTWTGSMTNQV